MKAKLMLLKTMTAISIRVVPVLLAGVIGCSSEKPIEIPKAPSNSVESTVPGDATPNPDSEKAPPENPRIAKFAELDTDHDGQLTLSEFTGERKPKEAERWFRLRDVDGDGVVNLTEYAPPLPISMTKPKSKDDAESKDGPVKTETEQPPTKSDKHTERQRRHPVKSETEQPPTEKPATSESPAK